MSMTSRRDLFKVAIAGAAGVTAANIVPGFIATAQAQTLSLPEKWHWETDILVAGGGFAGCMAALEAANSGQKVLLLQAGHALGGSSKISSGSIRAVKTRWHNKMGVTDTTEAYEKDILDYGKGTRFPAKAKVIAELSATVMNRIEDYGVTFGEDEAAIAYSKASGPTMRLIRTNGGGNAVMTKVIEQVKNNPNITVMLESKVLDVYKSISPDRFEGAVAEVEGEMQNIKAKAFILATGGFGRNQDLLNMYANEWKDTFRMMDLEDKGDGLLLATSHGAGSANLHIAMVVSTMEYTKKIFLSSGLTIGGGIYVNKEGRRFVNELVTYTDTPRAIIKEGLVYQVLTEGIHPSLEKLKTEGVVTKADSIEELAKLMHVPIDHLRATIDEHNAITAQPGERKDQFGRKVFGKPLVAPFYFLRVYPVMIETVGGMMINEKAEVVSLRNKPVMNGFYAAGAVAFGEHFGMGYRSGEAYIYSGVFGLVAAREAVAYTQKG